jgi:hypothetical protein
MRYGFVDVSTRRATIGDRRWQINIETVNMVPNNDFSGDSTDSIVTIAANVWAAVNINMRGLERVLSINTDKEETATHEFYIRFWNEAFLEARYISWKGVRYVIIRPEDIRGEVDHNYQIRFLCCLKGSTSKGANTWR